MVKKRIVIPKRYLKIAKQRGTKSLRHKKTGQMRGRVALKSGKGDSTKVRYFAKDVNIDLNKDGRISSNERFEAGHLFGRSKSKKVRASKKRRGTIRRFS